MKKLFELFYISLIFYKIIIDSFFKVVSFT